jgi:hypothetical protein
MQSDIKKKKQIDYINFHEFGHQTSRKKRFEYVRNNNNQNLHKPYYCFHPTPRTHVMITSSFSSTRFEK